VVLPRHVFPLHVVELVIHLRRRRRDVLGRCLPAHLRPLHQHPPDDRPALIPRLRLLRRLVVRRPLLADLRTVAQPGIRPLLADLVTTFPPRLVTATLALPFAPPLLHLLKLRELRLQLVHHLLGHFHFGKLRRRITQRIRRLRRPLLRVRPAALALLRRLRRLGHALCHLLALLLRLLLLLHLLGQVLNLLRRHALLPKLLLQLLLELLAVHLLHLLQQLLRLFRRQPALALQLLLQSRRVAEFRNLLGELL